VLGKKREKEKKEEKKLKVTARSGEETDGEQKKKTVKPQIKNPKKKNFKNS